MFGQTSVTAPAVCSYNRAWFCYLTYKWYQAFGRYIRDSFHSYSSVSFWVMDFKGNNDDFLAFGTSSTFCRLFFTANVGFINFNVALKKVVSGSPSHAAIYATRPKPFDNCPNQEPV